MAFLTEENFRAIYITDAATDIPTAQVAQCLAEAIDDLEDLCGTEAVEEVTASESTTDRKVVRFNRAQGKLAYRALLLILSSRFRSGGILVKESDATASVTDEYEKFDDIQKRRISLYKEAVRAVANYLITSGTEVFGESETKSAAVEIVW